MNTDKTHDSNLRRILQNPSLIGLENVVLSGSMFVFKSGKVITEADGVIFDEKRRIYVLEYKCGRNRYEEKADEQLKKSSLAVKRIFECGVIRIYISGSYPYSVKIDM